MRVVNGSAIPDATRSRDDPSGEDVLVLTVAPDPPRRLRAVERHPSVLAKLERGSVLPGLAIRGSSRGGVSRLQFTGHLGLAAEPLIQVWLNQAELASRDVVLIDLRHVSSMDEAGFLICLSAWGHAKLRGLRLRLANCRGDAERLLDETGTSEMFGASSREAGRAPVPESVGAGWSPILIPQVPRDQ
jgi:anti-anti-sigma factor